ncbi:MAG: membrane protein [Nitrospirales bacterium]|nr:MAG: membrane protein [Nitrospirales bacterium]
MKHLLVSALLIWYALFFFIMGMNPVDSQNWIFANILPILFVGFLTITYHALPFSSTSYLLFSFFLTLHTIGAHYTYAQTPVGEWIEDFLHLPRNNFDRIVHFCFGLLLAYPFNELFGKIKGIPSWLRTYLVFMTLIGLAGIWEILESWFARIVHPGLGQAFLGAQGDIWDAQKDMAATMYGALLCLSFMILIRKVQKPLSCFRAERLI